MNEKELKDFCHYYKGEKESPYKDDIRRTLWLIEELWLTKTKQKDEKYLTRCIEDYIDCGLSKFEQFDDVPITLKSVLFNRLMQYDERLDVEAFKKFYLEYYK